MSQTPRVPMVSYSTLSLVAERSMRVANLGSSSYSQPSRWSVCVPMAMSHRKRGWSSCGSLDGVTGDPTPARIEVLNSAGDSFVAEDALPISFVQDDARATNEPLSTALARFGKQLQSRYTGKNQFYAAGTARLRLPPGQYRMRVFKGPEYYVATKDVAVGARVDLVESITLRRFVDMPAEGWYSSDDHLHIPRTNQGVDPLIIKQMEAEDIHVSNLVSYGSASSSSSAAPQYSYGPASLYQERQLSS